MEFQGPTANDYANVESLNLAFLRLLQDRQDGERYLEGLPQDLCRCLRRLSDLESRRLATTPFLLFSLRERDDGFWQELLNGDRNRDLFAERHRPTDNAGRLVAAGLAFLWQLASRNPFAARLLCGASTHWCDQISECTFMHLLGAVAQRSDLLVLRAQHDTELWQKLLCAGLSDHTEHRRAARISALHYVLTHQQSAPAALSAAACASRDPALKVAEDRRS